MYGSGLVTEGGQDESRQAGPSLDQYLGFEGAAFERPKFGYLPPIAGDSQPLAVFHAVDYLAAVVAQIPD